MEDRGGERVILMSGTVINKLKLEQCQMCGTHYAPKVFIKHIEKTVNAPKESFDQNLCPECKRKAAAARIAGGSPDLLRVRGAAAQEP